MKVVVVYLEGNRKKRLKCDFKMISTTYIHEEGNGMWVE